jgi:hypothetical protein
VHHYCNLLYISFSLNNKVSACLIYTLMYLYPWSFEWWLNIGFILKYLNNFLSNNKQTLYTWFLQRGTSPGQQSQNHSQTDYERGSGSQLGTYLFHFISTYVNHFKAIKFTRRKWEIIYKCCYIKADISRPTRRTFFNWFQWYIVLSVSADTILHFWDIDLYPILSHITQDIESSVWHSVSEILHI